MHNGGVCAAVLAAAMLSLLAGCATSPVAPPDRSYTGRFSATTLAATAGGEQRQSVSGRFNFEIRGDHQRLELASPLGTMVARIDVEPSGARATGAQMQDVRGADADALTEQLLGWRLPVTGLSDWIEGRPVAGRPALVDRENGRIVAIEQDGWIIRLPEVFDISARPRRLLLERPGASNAPAVDLRLIIDEPG